MIKLPDALKTLQQVNRTAAFNEWAGFEVTHADDGEVEIRLPWRADMGQYSGFLHAGMIGALVDTACGFAAAAATGQRVLASHYSVNCLSPAVGNVFIAKGRVIRAGKRQIFAAAEVYAEKDGTQKLVASGETILVTAVD
jgi:uncharacterized protein (TIGR00369 family)